MAWDPAIPLPGFTDEERASSRPRDSSKVNIEAIVVFSDSRDYATDTQIIMDLLRSQNGRLKTVTKDPVSQRIPIHFSQGDRCARPSIPFLACRKARSASGSRPRTRR